MEKKIIYVAIDNAQFASEKECLLYEAAGKYSSVISSRSILMADKNGAEFTDYSSFKNAVYVECLTLEAAEYFKILCNNNDLPSPFDTAKAGIYYLENGEWKSYLTERTKLTNVLTIVNSFKEKAVEDQEES